MEYTRLDILTAIREIVKDLPNDINEDTQITIKVWDIMDIVDVLPSVSDEYPITSVSKSDLESINFDTTVITDDEMSELADRMADDYCDQLFWQSLEINAEDMGFKKIN